MKFQKEFNYCLLSVIIAAIIFVIFAFTKNIMVQLVFSILSVVIGSALVVLGFWGSDFAFAMASGQLHQEKIGGKIKGEKGKVYVPFMENYTPLEWWNLNWFITFAGVLLTTIGAMVLGIVFGVYIF